ncbi:MAG TPA: histidine kinase [Flavobacterium sp.]|nr:histidine kinase [Flavobacterium sp.]
MQEINSVFWLGTLTMLFLAFGLIFLVLFYQNYFSKMKRKEAEQLLKVSLDSEKNERQRIAADLHDSVAGDLSAIKNYLLLLQKTDNSLKDSPVFDEIKTGVENALENTRLISYKLMPPLLESFGLVAAVKDNFERLMNKTTASFAVVADEIPALPPTVSYEVFRVIQEFTTNMIKYGHITDCKVHINELPGHIQIEINDNGKSFNFAELLVTSKGTGLKNINSRLKVIEAELTQQKTTTGNHFTITLKK